jgi:transposase InsO family protein
VTPYDRVPKYIVHDNDPVFKSRNFKKLLDDSGVKGITTGKEAPWQNPYAERVIGTIRRELLDYVVPLNELHLDKLLKEYVNAYYNPHRTHHGLRGDTPIPHRQYLPTDVAETTLRKTRILGGLYHTLEKVG